MDRISRNIPALSLLVLAAAGLSTAQVTTSGTLTWNANGSLAQLAGVDSFNAANAATCNYTYDDLGRLGQIDCGAGNWGQTYTYDSFGNIRWAPPSGHTGSQFQPVYDTSKNRISSFGSYDANGNLTSDGLHTYAWDAEGNLSQLDGGTAMVYDAFGRRVEQTNSSGTAEILYGPDESKLAWGSYEDTADSLADRRRHRADSLDADGRCRRAVPEAV